MSGKESRVRLSKTMSYLLRHGAGNAGLAMDSRGFIALVDLLQHRSIAAMKATEDTLRKVVADCPKQRFYLEEREDGRTYIRANQGHSIADVDVEMERLVDCRRISMAVHGTSYLAWDKIAHLGLSKMGRQHIHMATRLPSTGHVISGIRNSAQILIYLDLEKLIAENVPIFLSENSVLLTPGISDGFIPPHYFTKVIDVATNENLLERPGQH